MTGMRSSSKRTEYIRTGRRASCGPRGFDGSQDPVLHIVKTYIIVDFGKRDVTHVWAGGVALQIWLDRLVLLVEQGKIRNKILDDVGVRQWVDARLLSGIGRNTACSSGQKI